MSNVDNNEIPVEGLTKENQEKWQRSVKNYLVAQGFWDVVDGTFARPPDNAVNFGEWTRKNDDALSAIRNSSGSRNSHHLRGVLEAKRAWEILTHIYDDVDPPVHLKILNDQIYADNLKGVRETLDQHEGALTARVNYVGHTALHIAAQAGHLRIVQELITRLPPDDLLIPSDSGNTPLSKAAYVGIGIDVATAIFEANKDILTTPDNSKRLPVTMAFSFGHTQLGLHLYTATIEHLQLPDGTLRIHNLPNGRALAANLLGSCFISQQHGTALNFLSIPGNRYLLLEKDNDGKSAIERIATLQGRDRPVAIELLNKVCEKVGDLGRNSSRVGKALFLAIRGGNVEFVKRVSNAYPTEIVLCDPTMEWNIFFYAVAYRQAQIFDHIRVLRLKNMLASMRDNDENTLLHVVAKLDPPAKLKLDRITGPALQMQRELQWFKEVESVVPEWVKEHKNNKDLTPRELFKETHKELRKEGEEWMKSAATSGSVVAALIVTIMFTAAFTVPGGFDSNSGLPPLREKQRKWFMTFIFSDVISLIFSIASVLTFLTILTSRFDEEDFLMSLPTKLILGLFSLLMSIITMFIAFSANIVSMLHKTSYLWVYPPIILLAIVLVIFFSWLQLSSFYDMVRSTYFPGIFNKEVKPWLRNVFNEERDPIAIDEGNDVNHIHPAPAIAIAPSPV